MKQATAFFLICVAVWLGGCAPNPIDLAEARRIDAQTAQDVEDREQARVLREAQAERDAERDAAEASRWSRIWDAVAAGAEVAAGLASFLIVTAFGIGMASLFMGMAQAIYETALMRANLIPLDKTTRQYPMLRVWRSDDGKRLTARGSGMYMLANPNDGSVMTLNVRQEGDAQKIAGMISAWDAGIVAEAAVKAKDSNSDGVAMIAGGAAQIVDASARTVRNGA